MSMFTTLIEQYQAYLHLQHRISKAISNRDERLLMQLKQASQELFFKIEDNRKSFVKVGDSEGPRQFSFQADLSQLIQLMEQVQQPVRENEAALQIWLDQMKSDIQHHRTFQSSRGVLATYVQQEQVASVRITDYDNTLASSERVILASPATNPPSPWTVPAKDSKTVGHQVNHQS